MTKGISDSTCCGAEAVVEQVDVARDSGHESSSSDRLKELVRDRYAKSVSDSDGCGCGCSSKDAEYSFVGEEYSGREGYEADADLGLGCGVPTDIAGIKKGDTVLDLGSGAGIDAFIASEEVGETGEVIGVDFTPEMVQKAKQNAAKLGYINVRFVEGDIEHLPVPQRSVDVVISNCVLNLVPDKEAAFAEMYRVIRPGGHFAVSDIVILGELPDRLRDSAALYAGCVSGAIARDEYLALLTTAGFTDVEVARERVITIPDSILLQVANRDEIDAFSRSGGIASITVTGVRAA